MKKRFVFVWVAFVLTGLSTQAVERYVNLNNPAPVAPYISWATAATNIQNAVDAAAAGDVVWVTNGIYNSGSRGTPGYACTNRVVITNDIHVRSVNGPDVTFIAGAEAISGFNGGNGSTAVRGVYMSAGLLAGFTITNGHTQTYGSTSYDRSGGGINLYGGNGVVSNCILTGNSAFSCGGGSYYGTLNNCVLTGNSVSNYYGGGSDFSTLINCTLSSNSAEYGGGSHYGTLVNCTLSGNSARTGGGSYYSTLYNCTLSGNSAEYGGGSAEGTLFNCILTGNSASEWGGGSCFGKLYSCTLSGNSASNYGGGSVYGTLNNCIVYFNNASSERNWRGSTFAYSCTAPLPEGTGNITNAPMLVSASHLHADSPCVGVGSAAYSVGVDIDGESWRSPPSMGCDEPVAPMIGALTVFVSADYREVAQGYVLNFSAVIAGEVASNRWTFGDGTALTNAILGVQHAWASTGSYPVVVTAWNDDYPAGISATTQVEVVEASFYVDADNASPAAPYTNWATAATNIQDAVDEAGRITTVGRTVWVADGVYNSGGRVTPGYACTNRVVITNDIRVQSVNGPGTAFIVGAEASGGGNGSNAVRGVYMSAGLLSGFTVTNGHTRTNGDNSYDKSGGGINLYGGSGIVNNCTLTGNSAVWGSGSNYGTLYSCTLSGNSASSAGGGSYGGTLYNCTLSGNSASFDGGGSCYGKLYSCTLSGNSASNAGGGSYLGALFNCIVYFNSASSGSNWYGSTFAYSCTVPLPEGEGNITDDPQFVDASAGNFRLKSTSPCINAGSNARAPADTDLDGNPRINGSTVDMGAYEYDASFSDSDGDDLPDGWESFYFGDATNALPGAVCSNGLNTLMEAYIAGFDPVDSNVCFAVESIERSQDGFVVSWHSVPGRVYDVFRTLGLDQGFQLLEAGLNYPVNSYTDTVHSASSNGFYKISVRLPEP